MSRRSQVVRNHTTASSSELPPPSENFTWNAMLGMSDVEALPGGVSMRLNMDHIWHRSTDNDIAVLDDRNVIRVPVDAIYSVSGRVWTLVPPEYSVPGAVRLTATSNDSLAGASAIDEDIRVHQSLPDASDMAMLHVAHAGWPLGAGGQLWLQVENLSEYEVWVKALSFSVTYEAAIGTVTPPGGG